MDGRKAWNLAVSRVSVTALDWREVFATIQTAGDHPSKPHPSMLVGALDDVGLEPTVAGMIGDTSFYMAMADAAGVAQIVVAWGFHAPTELRTAGATILVASFDELLTVQGETSRVA